MNPYTTPDVLNTIRLQHVPLTVHSGIRRRLTKRLASTTFALLVVSVGAAQAEEPPRSSVARGGSQGPIATYLSANGVPRLETGEPAIQQARQSRSRSPWFPVKVGAIVGCGTGAVLGFTLSPYVGDPGPFGAAQRLKATAEMCVILGAAGAVVGFLIATR